MPAYLVGGHTVSKHAYTVITEQQDEITRLKALLAQCEEALEQWVKCCEMSRTIRTEIAVPLRTLAAIEKEGL